MDPGTGRERCAGSVSPDAACAEVDLPAKHTLVSHLSFMDIIPFPLRINQNNAEESTLV